MLSFMEVSHVLDNTILIICSLLLLLLHIKHTYTIEFIVLYTGVKHLDLGILCSFCDTLVTTADMTNMTAYIRFCDHPLLNPYFEP